MLNSYFRELCPVSLPYAGRQHYMHGFDLAAPKMLDGFEDYLAPVMALTRAAGAFVGKAWMTVDEKIVGPGMSQRRPGPHVDGQFSPEHRSWSHGPGGGWNHGCNSVPMARMPVIVAASAIGCRAWEGRFDAEPRNDGDLSHVQLGEGSILPASVGFLLSPDCVHESMIMREPTPRSFLRIALPVDFDAQGTLLREDCAAG